ncbi:MAG: tRNA preQ1(34) S-adenosylmethionine ribosyltransferase-isomerase QueA [Phycisphaerae bacterium]|nr:tRNA preQ1(34) S-adenosylmethionine ribosyltransferase-isomerase QueA [Phycisphaerae bacterium]
MKTELLNYDLPKHLIAQQPAQNRSESRLLVLHRKNANIEDRFFNQIGQYLHPGDCLVLNDTKVLAARFYAHKNTGANLQGLFLSQRENGIWDVYLKGVRKIKEGDTIELLDRQGTPALEAKLLEKGQDGKAVLKVEAEDAYEILERIGYPPLPPYIKRDEDAAQAQTDLRRYQTVYAEKPGAVAAPTAGLHFTRDLLAELEKKGIIFARVTLHVGAGTFKPVTADDLRDHKIHSEYFSLDAANAEIINTAKRAGKRVIAVGTTSVRVLETAAVSPQTPLAACSGQTELFIMPGFEFKIVDAMVTNFHLPKSTLLALAAGFAGLDKVLAAYRHAVENQYRFFSYGDAMLII